MVAILAVYFSLVGLISGWAFTLEQFSRFWYFITGLAAGFGIQIGLFSYLKSVIYPHTKNFGVGVHHPNASGKMVAVTGTTSTVAMISCCAHYLANILPIIAATGVAAFVSQYQVKFFWIGLAFNLIGIVYIGIKIVKFQKS